MGYFTTTPAGFDDALKVFGSVREYRVRIDPDGTPVDLTSLLDNNSVAIRHEEGSGAEADLRLRNGAGTFSEGDYANQEIGIDARIDSSDWIPVFYGFVDEKGAKLDISAGNAARARLHANTLEKRFGTRQKPTPSVLTDWTICDEASPSTSIVHKLAELMGLASGDLDVGTIDYAPSWIELGKRSPWQELRDLADLYRADIYTTAAGKLRLRSLLFEDTPPSLSAEWSFANDDSSFPPNLRDLRSPIQGEYMPISCNRGTCEFDEYIAMAAGSVIWLCTESFDPVTRRIYIALDPGEYWPIAASADSVAKLQYSEPITGEAIPYATDVITPTVGTPGSGSDIESNNGLPTIISFNGSTGATKDNPTHAEIILKNETAGTIVIYKFQIRGTGYRVKANHTVTYQDAAVTDDEDFVDETLPGTYAASEQQVYYALQDLVDRGKGGRRRWVFTTIWLPQVQLQARVNVRMPGGVYALCRIVGYTHPAPNGPMLKAETRLEVEELGSFSPSGAVVPEVSIPGTLQPAPGYEEFDEEIADRPTYEDLDDGYDAPSGGTTTPTVPTVTVSSAFKALVVRVDRQASLTNFDRYEFQVSDDDATWYSLEFDGSDWKDTLAADTDWTDELLIHEPIPFGGTDDTPTAVTLYYRARRVTKLGTASDWSSSASAATQLVQTKDFAAQSVTAAKVSTGFLQALYGAIGYLLTIGFSGSGSPDTPNEGDTRLYLDEDEFKVEEGNSNSEWSPRARIGMRSGAHVADQYASGYMRAGQALLSTPGQLWRPVDLGLTTSLSIAFGNGLLVAAGSDSPYVRWSDDYGDTFNDPTSGAAAAYFITFGHNLFFTFGGNTRYSADGDVWSTPSTPPTGSCFAGCWMGGDHWAAGNSSGYMFHSSDDGDTFSSVGDVFSGSKVRAIRYSEALDVGIAVADDNQMAYSTDNGASWTLLTSPFASGDITECQVNDINIWIIGTSTGHLGRCVGDPTDSDDWEDLGEILSTSTQDTRAIAYGDGMWFACQEDAVYIYRSADQGETWTYQSYSGARATKTTAKLGSVKDGVYIAEAERYVLVGSLAAIAISEWIEAGSGILQVMQDDDWIAFRFGIGIQVVVERWTLTSEAMTTASGNIYYGPANTWTYSGPTFTDVLFASIQSMDIGGCWILSTTGGMSSTAKGYRVASSTSKTSTIQCCGIVVGLWK